MGTSTKSDSEICRWFGKEEETLFQVLTQCKASVADRKHKLLKIASREFITVEYRHDIEAIKRIRPVLDR